jgi:hypothetical protein
MPITAVIWIMNRRYDEFDCSALRMKDNWAHCSTARSSFQASLLISRAASDCDEGCGRSEIPIVNSG